MCPQPKLFASVNILLSNTHILNVKICKPVDAGDGVGSVMAFISSTEPVSRSGSFVAFHVYMKSLKPGNKRYGNTLRIICI